MFTFPRLIWYDTRKRSHLLVQNVGRLTSRWQLYAGISGHMVENYLNAPGISFYISWKVLSCYTCTWIRRVFEGYKGLLLLQEMEEGGMLVHYNLFIMFTVRYNMVLDITQFKDGSQKCTDYIENDHQWSFFNIIYTFLFGYNTVV